MINDANLASVSLPKANFDVTKAHDVAIFNLPRFAIRNPATVYERAVSGASISNHERAFLIHHQRRVNF